MLTTRSKNVLIIMFALMIVAIFKYYPTNYESLFTPLNKFVELFIFGSMIISILCLFNNTRLPGKKELSNISFLHLIFTLGIAMGFFSQIISPEFITKYPEAGNPYMRLIHYYGPSQWCIYVPFLLIELYDANKGLPKPLHIAKCYLYAVTMMLAIGITLLCGCTTVSKILGRLFDVNINPYYLVTPIGSLAVFSAILGIKRGMRVMSNISMTLMYILTITIVSMTFSWVFFPYIRDIIAESYSNLINWNIYNGTTYDIKVDRPFYIWLISWIGIMSPFIRKISSGRTLRSVVLTMTLGPSLVCTLVIALMSYAFTHHNYGTDSYSLITSNMLVSLLYLLMLIFMFITSADSTVYSFDNMVSEGNNKHIAYRKILWTTLMCVFVTVLMICGGGSIDALFGISYLTVPFIILLGLICAIYIGYVKWRKLK